MVSPSQKRRVIKQVVEQGKGTIAEACRALGLQRSTFYRNSTVSADRLRKERAIVELSEEHPRYGYPCAGNCPVITWLWFRCDGRKEHLD